MVSELLKQGDARVLAVPNPLDEFLKGRNCLEVQHPAYGGGVQLLEILPAGIAILRGEGAIRIEPAKSFHDP
jgi:hypothetical protein